MEIPEIGDQLFFSPDGKTWSSVPARVITPRQLTMTSTLRNTGYFLAATSLPALAAPQGHESRGALLVGVITGMLALLVFAVGYAVVRVRRRSP